MEDSNHGGVAQAEQSTVVSRRSPRRPISIPVWLRREAHDRTWEEETETRVLSRHGAGLECRHSIETGGELAIIRRDTGERVNVRVSYCRYNAEGRREIGVEFLNGDNFWGGDWTFVEPEIEHPETLRKPPSPAEEEPVALIAHVAEDQPQPKKRTTRARANRLDQMLIDQERRLWEAFQAKNKSVLEILLAPELTWISAAGVETNAHDLQNLCDTNSTDCLLDNFKVTKLSKAAAIVTFQAVERAADHSQPFGPYTAYHSSIWIQRAGRWEIQFHQQTLAQPGSSAPAPGIDKLLPKS